MDHLNYCGIIYVRGGPMFVNCQTFASSWGRRFVALQYRIIHYFVERLWPRRKFVGKGNPQRSPTNNDDSAVLQKSIPSVWQQCQSGIHWRTMCDINNYVTEYVWILFKFFCFKIKPIKFLSFWIIFLLSYQSLVQLLTLLTRCWADQWMKRTVEH